MKIRLLLFIAAVIFSVGLKAQKKGPDYRKLHYLSQEEMLKPLNFARDFIETDPPTPEVRNVAEFDQMQAVLVRYPFGVPISLIKEMAEETEVITIVASAGAQQTVETIYIENGVNMDNTAFLMAPTDSYWVRDYGPWFVFDGDKNPGIMDFPYNRPRPNDNNIPAAVAEYLDIDLYGMNVYQTGGNYMCDGMGQAASTDLVYEENPQLSNDEVDQKHELYLGIDTYHVRPDPLDDYIKHIDCWGKFLSPGKVIIGQVPATDYRYPDFEDAANYFATHTSSYGKLYEVVRVYTPGTSPNTPYTNSLILNKKVFVPITGSEWDDEALAVYEEAMPGYEIIGIMYDGWLNTDALHCRTKGVADIGMLYIHHVPLLGNVGYLENYEINAKILVNSNQPIYNDSVLIYYSINEGEYEVTNMSYIGNDEWTGTISGIMPGDEVDYYLYAADWSGRRANHPYIGQADPHEFIPFGSQQTQLEMNPDTVMFLTYEDALYGQELAIVNISDDTVKINDITEFGNTFDWYVEEIPELPYFLPDGDTLKLNIKVDFILSSFMGELIGDTMYITTPMQTYEQLIMIDEDLITIIVDNEIREFVAYPNPFKDRVRFSFLSESVQKADLKIFDNQGRVVYRNQFNTTVGNNLVEWDGKSLNGSSLKQGVYIYQFQVGDKNKKGKLVLR